MATHASFSHLETLFDSAEEDPAKTADTVLQMTSPSPALVQNDSEKKLWAKYMEDAGQYDGHVAESWKEDSNGILVFTGLFSATVGAFIIEFYKKLSPDSGDQTVALLCQISQQLPNFANGSCSTPQIGQSFSPSASIIWVNAMWIMSLLLSLTAALFATLLQQWARRYVQIPQVADEPKRRARVRSFLFFGTQKYKMLMAVETAPALLHLSVFLFFAGLVIIFFTIHKTVAIIVSISVGIFVVAYVALTFLPYFYRDCPYRTPMSNIWWYISHPSLFSISFCFYWLFKQLRRWIVPDNLGEVVHNRQRIILPVMGFFERAVDKHSQRLKDGFRRTILQGALQASEALDVKALTWWLQLPTLAEESKAQDIFACLPEQTILELMRNPIGKPVFLNHLLTLLESCQSGSLAVGLDEDERKTRLRVCLHTILCITRHHINQNSDVNGDFDFMRSNFANISLMRTIWANSDTGSRVTSRTICALLARHLLGRGLLGESELLWLQDVTGEPSNTIFNSDPATQDNMNLKGFVYGVLAHQVDLPAEQATSFTETLAILMDAGTQIPFDRSRFQTELSGLIVRIDQDTKTEGSAEVAQKLRRMFPGFLPSPAAAAGPQP